MTESGNIVKRPVNRRSLLKGGLLAGGAATLGVGLLGKRGFGLRTKNGSSLNSGRYYRDPSLSLRLRN